MIPAKKAIPVLVLSILLLTTSASVSASSPHGRWSGTVAAIAGDDLALVGVAERFHLAGSVTELVSGRTLSPREPRATRALRYHSVSTSVAARASNRVDTASLPARQPSAA